MGVSVTYRSIDPVSAEVRKAIVDAAARVNATREWWAESIIFLNEPAEPARLTGDTKLFVASADYHEDTLMAALDFEFIVDQLSRWSSQYGVGWTLLLEGGEVGTIRNGQPDEAARLTLEELFESTPLDRNSREEILARYAGDEEEEEEELPAMMVEPDKPQMPPWQQLAIVGFVLGVLTVIVLLFVTR